MMPNEYQQLALRTEVTPLFVNDAAGNPSAFLSRLFHGAMGMDTEQAELMDMLKKHFIYGKQLDEVNVLEECGDGLWYIALALDACGFTLEEAMVKNIEKLRKRYPDKFSPEKALNRDLEGERKVLEAKG